MEKRRYFSQSTSTGTSLQKVKKITTLHQLQWTYGKW